MWLKDNFGKAIAAFLTLLALGFIAFVAGSIWLLTKALNTLFDLLFWLVAA